MARNWTFGQKIAAGFAVTVALCIVTSGIAIFALRSVVEGKDQVITVNARNKERAAELRTDLEQKSSDVRGYLLTREDRFLDDLRSVRKAFAETLLLLKAQTDDAGKQALDRIERSEVEHQSSVEKALALRKTESTPEASIKLFDEQVLPKKDDLEQQMRLFVTHEERMLESAKQAATDSASTATTLVIAAAVVAALFAIAVGWFLTRALTTQIGGAVQHVQSSSAELQAAATQQATGSREQATSMNEIATTITELLATSRQIAESALRVAQISEQAASAATGGDHTVQKSLESAGSIKRQVDQIVLHMLDLGKKSQQIGAVLEIIDELAEQTNILAINATIEAAGAGESGRRFSVVADEIRKLADRVASSTKEIRTLIDEIRAAVNTTVMSTESASKTVDSGARQFNDVASSFRHIAELVGTTTEAAREIQLSTKQQTTAVEQVNIAISNVAQATKETETSASQTLQTATTLTTLSRNLNKLIQTAA